jgi:hypothetical protein
LKDERAAIAGALRIVGIEGGGLMMGNKKYKPVVPGLRYHKARPGKALSPVHMMEQCSLHIRAAKLMDII